MPILYYFEKGEKSVLTVKVNPIEFHCMEKKNLLCCRELENASRWNISHVFHIIFWQHIERLYADNIDDNLHED